MTRRFDGAITIPADSPDSTLPPAAVRPTRPMGIELSSAILIVGGAFATIGTLTAVSADAGMLTGGAGLVVGLLIVLNLLTVIVGLLVRRGAAWILCTNVAAVVLFVELTGVPSGGAFAAGLAALDAFVFISLMRNRHWFDWRPPPEGPVP